MQVEDRHRRYAEALQRGHEALWGKRWSAAVAAYREALAALPDQPEALTGLGLACMEAGRYGEALEAFQRLADLQPEDPIPVLRMAEILQRMGRSAEAAAHYHRAGQLFAAREDWRRAAQAWGQAWRLDPGRMESLEALAQAYRRLDQREAAVRVDLARARAWVQRGDLQRALQAVSEALALDPDHPQALQARDWLRAQLARRTGTGPLSARPLTEGGRGLEAERARAEALWGLPLEEAAREAEASLDPIARALAMALQELADLIFAEDRGGLSEETWFQASVLLGRAVDAHARGQFREALALYQQVSELGLQRPSLSFAMGVLLVERQRCEEAAAHLARAAEAPAFHLAGLLLRARCERQQGRLGPAAGWILEALEAIDRTLVPEAAAALRERYRFLRAWIERHPDRQAALVEESLATLGSATWEDRLAWMRRALDQWAEGIPFRFALADVLMAPKGEWALLELGQAYLWARGGLFYSALEEGMRVVAAAPLAPVAHLALGQILAWGSRGAAAAAKFRALGDYFRYWGDDALALALFDRAAQLTPFDLLTLRQALQLAQAQGDAPRILHYFGALADAHLQMADLEGADQACREGLRWASRHGVPAPMLRPLWRRLADLALQRLDWTQAAAFLESLRRVDPDDAETRWSLVEVYLRLGRGAEASRELEGLIEEGRSTGRWAEWRARLEELRWLFPEEPALRQALARLPPAG